MFSKIEFEHRFPLCDFCIRDAEYAARIGGEEFYLCEYHLTMRPTNFETVKLTIAQAKEK